MELGIEGLSDGTEIGVGASAVVYKATQLDLSRDVAVKLLSVSDPAFIRRFKREAKTLGKLSQSSGIVTIYDTGVNKAGQPFLILELCQASLLDQLRNDGPLEPVEACRILAKVAVAVSEAHEAGVVHRDLKPGNVLVSADDRFLVTDFGISTVSGTTTGQTSSVGFTAGYVAPETIMGEEVGPAADVYSLGATLFHIITGDTPFSSPDGDANLLALVNRIATEPLPDLRQDGVPDVVCRTIEWAMSKDPLERPTAEQLHQRLQAIAEGKPVPDESMAETRFKTRAPGASAAVVADEQVDEPVDGDEQEAEHPEGTSPESTSSENGSPPDDPDGQDQHSGDGQEAGEDADATEDEPITVGLFADGDDEPTVRPLVVNASPDDATTLPPPPVLLGDNAGGGFDVLTPTAPTLRERLLPDRLPPPRLLAGAGLCIVLLAAIGLFTFNRDGDGGDGGGAEGGTIEAVASPDNEQDQSSEQGTEQSGTFDSIGPPELRAGTGSLTARASVPDVVGETEQLASTQLVDGGFRVSAVSVESSRPNGEVVDQNPAGGERAAEGTLVSIYVSRPDPPALITIPTVRGLSIAEATAALEGRGLRVAGEPQFIINDDVPEGQAIGTSPGTGVRVNDGAAVELFISAGGPQVPDVAGRTVADATSILESQLFIVGSSSSEPSDTVAEGRVIRTNPSAGTSANAGSTVNLVISSGPPDPLPAGPCELPIPTVEGMTLEQAQAALARTECPDATVIPPDAASANKVLSVRLVDGVPELTVADIPIACTEETLQALLISVIGKQQGEAVAEINAAGCGEGLNFPTPAGADPIGQVVFAADAGRGLIDLTVTEPSCTMPNLIGAESDSVRGLLDSQGCAGQVSLEGGPGIIVDQDPPSGTEILVNMDVFAATGVSPPCVVPEVVGMEEAAARAQLNPLACIRVVTVSMDLPTGDPGIGTVVSQSAFGTVPEGTAITLTIGVEEPTDPATDPPVDPPTDPPGSDPNDPDNDVGVSPSG